MFADIIPSTLTIDVRDVERRVTPRTKAIIPVVYAGVAPEMDELMLLAQQHKLVVVEDAAQAHLATYQDRLTGTFGEASAFSLQATKNLSGVEGGLVTRGVGLVGRIGYVTRSPVSAASRWSVGGGVELRRLHLDYAYQGFALVGGGTHRVGVRWAL